MSLWMLVDCSSIADEAQEIASIAPSGLSWVIHFIAKHPDDPGITKEQAVRALAASIECQDDQTPEDYKRLTAPCWEALMSIVMQPGGHVAFKNAEVFDWLMTRLDSEPNHVKVSSLHDPAFPNSLVLLFLVSSISPGSASPFQGLKANPAPPPFSLSLSLFPLPSPRLGGCVSVCVCVCVRA